MALCGMGCLNLKTNAIKELGIHFSSFSYNRRLENGKNYRECIIKIKKIIEIVGNVTANN